MSKIVNASYRYLFSYIHVNKLSKRTFLSESFYLKEAWNARHKSPILQNVQLEELYHELDTNYNKIKNISAVDVDIFVNSIQNDGHVDEILDLVHKLRLSADSGNTLPSTEHAVIRNLIDCGHHEKLLQVLDDRLNYGIFLDNYTASILLDTFWKKKDYTSGAKVAAQMMLQENFTDDFVMYLSLLHCFNYLKNPVNWAEPVKPEESTEEIKVRVKFLRNSYFDDHFDLTNPQHIIGKTVGMIGEMIKDEIGLSFKIIGLGLRDKWSGSKDQIIKEIADLCPIDSIKQMKTIDLNVTEFLEKKIQEAATKCSTSNQIKVYEDWIKLRQSALDKQLLRLETLQRLETLEDKQEQLKQREKLLWYFDNKEQIELEIEDKRVFYPKRFFGKKKKPRQVDESYIPPEVQKTYSKEN